MRATARGLGAAAVALLVAALALETLPTAVAMLFAAGPTERIVETCSFFSLLPIGYAHVTPMLTGALTVAAILLGAASLFRSDRAHRLRRATLVCSVLALLLSVFPLLLFGPIGITATGCAVSGLTLCRPACSSRLVGGRARRPWRRLRRGCVHAALPSRRRSATNQCLVDYNETRGAGREGREWRSRAACGSSTRGTTRARLAPRHGQVEFLTTMSYVGRYLPAGGRVLDVGAGTGRYSHALARRGHRVDAVELVERNIEAFRARTGPGEDVTVVQGDARDLGRFPDDAYDVTLLLGPLYHLHGAGDKRRALSEAARVTRPGGVVLAAHVVSDGCLVDLGFSRGEIDVAAYVRNGLLDAGTFASVPRDGDVFDLVRREDADALLAGLPVERLHYVASDGLAPLIAESLDAMGDEAFDLFMRWHLATCERGDFVGLTSHSLDVLRVL